MKRTNVNVLNKCVSIFWESKPGPVYDLQKIKLGHTGNKKIIAEVAKDAMGNIEWIKIRT